MDVLTRKNSRITESFLTEYRELSLEMNIDRRKEDPLISWVL